MHIRHCLAAGLATVLLATMGAASAADSARARLQQFAEGVHSLSCSFVQRATDARGDFHDEVKGTLALQSPRQFRWSTEAPQAQLIVADGARVWIYDPELEQVTVRRQSTAEAQSPLTVLTDLSRLDVDFTVSEQGEHDGLSWLRLVPRSDDAPFSHADIGLDGDEPRQMIFADTLGGGSSIRFSDWRRNPDLAASTFQFTPPEGVDVVGDEVTVPQIQGAGD